MKLWEAMKLLEEDPTRKFEHQDDRKKWILYADVCYDDLVFYQLDCWDSKGELRTGDAFGSLHDNLTTSDNWQPVKQPLTWHEAIQEFAKGKKVIINFNNQEWDFESLILLPSYLDVAITNGNWRVED